MLVKCAAGKSIIYAMRTFLIFLGFFALAAIISGLITYPIWILVQQVADYPIHKVMGRVGMLVLAATTIWFLRRRGLANKSTLGYDMPRPEFTKQLFIGFAAGVTLMMPLVVGLFGLDIRVLSQRYLESASHTTFVLKLVAQGLLTGFAVAFLEETFCRGALFTAIRRESGLLLAIVLPTLLYAATHFLDGKLKIPNDQVTYLSGLQVTATLFQRFSAPWLFFDSFLALFALGVLLSVIRLRTGVIAGCIGVHAGGVAVIVVMRNLSATNAASSWSWLVGSYDGVIGWMAAIWIAMVTLAYWQVSKNPRT